LNLSTEHKIDQCCEVTLQLAYSLVERAIDKHWTTIKQNDKDKIASDHADILPPFAEALKTLKVAGDNELYRGLIGCLGPLKLCHYLLTKGVTENGSENDQQDIFDLLETITKLAILPTFEENAQGHWSQIYILLTGSLSPVDFSIKDIENL